FKQIPCLLRKYSNNQNIFAVEINDFKTFSENDIECLVPQDKNAFILIVDNFQDPHNFGACIRSAHSAGIDLIIIP
ncbi:23S rRNA (guanosine(2251)-2'-O)-methyltransferase RlmB, partial [Francisella tularensis subsp. holarctica]|nr:23S rRNA (guanosine(2251)-2'-O)-methyltransferase RlmB [Francisella tularensis subsp. holarctica]